MEHDFAVTAFRVAQEATTGVDDAQLNVVHSGQQSPKDKNPAAVALGRLGGLKGGKARAAKLTQKQRSEIARRAATARWAKATE